MASDEQISVSEAPHSHLSITCDGCGMSPIVGIRYKSKLLYDFDLCESCIESDEEQKDNYISFQRPMSSQEAFQFRYSGNRHTYICDLSLCEAAKKIARVDQNAQRKARCRTPSQGRTQLMYLVTRMLCVTQMLCLKTDPIQIGSLASSALPFFDQN